MRTALIESYRPQVERAIQYIVARLDRPLTVREVAGAAHLSEFHFHRIFTAVVGEPIGRFIARRRLETAALQLAYQPDRSVGDIALASGYSSLSNFSKAFAAHFGCSPTRLRRPGERPPAVDALTRAHAPRFDPRDLYALPPAVPAAERRAALDRLTRDLRFATRPAVPVACLASPEGYDLPAQLATWRALVDHALALGLAGDDVDAYGMAHDSPTLTAADRCRYHACVPCPIDRALPDPLFRAVIPAGRYAIFRYRGPTDAAPSIYRAIYSLWLPTSGVAPDGFVAVDHYDRGGPVDDHIDYEILIKIRPRDGH